MTRLAARWRGWSRLHRTRVISERHPAPQCQPGAPSPTECCPRSPGRAAARLLARFKFPISHRAGASTPFYRGENRGEGRRGETTPDGKWLWQACNSGALGPGSFLAPPPRSRMGEPSGEARTPGPDKAQPRDSATLRDPSAFPGVPASSQLPLVGPSPARESQVLGHTWGMRFCSLQNQMLRPSSLALTFHPRRGKDHQRQGVTPAWRRTQG